MKKIFLLLVAAFSASAQDFGYEYAVLSEFRTLGFSYNLQNFKARPSNQSADTARIQFSTALPFVEFRQNTGRLAIGFQTYTTNIGAKKESFSVYGETVNDFPLSVSRDMEPLWFIPVMISANYVRAEAPLKSLEDFDIGSFGIGTGIKFKHFTRSYGILAGVTGSIYYASEGFSTDYGSQTSMCGEVQLILPGVIYQGIQFVYRFESQQWNMNNNLLDYQRQYHGLFVGLLF